MSVVAPPAATTEWMLLPRAASLTDALLAPAPPPAPAFQTALALRVRRTLDRRIGGAAGRPEGRCVRIGAFQMVQALDDAASGRDDPFRWSSRTARRAIGLTAVQACAADTVASPSAGVARTMAFVRGRGAPTPAVPDSLVEWVGTLSAPARTAVAAEATTWATRLWTALDWSRLPVVTAIGGADEWWHHLAGNVRVAVRGRVDVRTTSSDGSAVLFSICGGWPTPAGRTALVLAALVGALHHPGAPGPARVVGWWPESGRAWIVQVDERALSVAADGVVTAAHRAVRTSR